MFRVHEVAEATTVAVAFLVLATFGFTEVSNGGVLGLNEFITVVSAIEGIHGALSLLLVPKFNVDVAYHMVTDIVSNHHLIDITKICQLHKDFLVEGLKVVYCFSQFVLLYLSSISKGYCSLRVGIHVLENHGLG